MHETVGYAHMDVKLENVLIGTNEQLKLCDFGFSMPVNSYVDKKMGTLMYMAPELHHASTMPCKAAPTDVFSMGVLFFMLAFGTPPFHSAENSDSFFTFLKIKPGHTDFFKFHPHTRNLFREGKIPISFMKMLLTMLMTEPS